MEEIYKKNHSYFDYIEPKELQKNEGFLYDLFISDKILLPGKMKTEKEFEEMLPKINQDVLIYYAFAYNIIGPNKNEDDSIKSNIIYKYIIKYRYNNLIQAYIFLFAIFNGNKTEFRRQADEAYELLKNNIETLIDLYDSEIIKKDEYKTLYKIYGEFVNLCGCSFYNAKEYDNAEKFYLIAIKLGYKTWPFVNLGRINIVKKKTNVAIDYYKLAIDNCLNTKDLYIKNQVLSELLQLITSVKDMPYIKQAADEGNKQALNKLIDIYVKEKDYDNIIKYKEILFEKENNGKKPFESENIYIFLHNLNILIKNYEILENYCIKNGINFFDTYCIKRVGMSDCIINLGKYFESKGQLDNKKKLNLLHINDHIFMKEIESNENNKMIFKYLEANATYEQLENLYIKNIQKGDFFKRIITHYLSKKEPEKLIKIINESDKIIGKDSIIFIINSMM